MKLTSEIRKSQLGALALMFLGSACHRYGEQAHRYGEQAVPPTCADIRQNICQNAAALTDTNIQHIVEGHCQATTDNGRRNSCIQNNSSQFFVLDCPVNLTVAQYRQVFMGLCNLTANAGNCAYDPGTQTMTSTLAADVGYGSANQCNATSGMTVVVNENARTIVTMYPR